MNVISTQSMILSLSLFLTLTVSVLADKTINGVPLRYGSLVRIKPQTSNHFLHSRKVPVQLEGPSIVTGFQKDQDIDSLWSIQQPYSVPLVYHKSHKDVVRCGDSISLIHSLTGGSLQTSQGSIGLVLPQQLITNSHKPLESNSNWVLECDTGKDLRFGDTFRLKHINSQKYVRISKQNIYDSANCGRVCSMINHLQVHAIKEQSPETLLSVVEGITFTS